MRQNESQIVLFLTESRDDSTVATTLDYFLIACVIASSVLLIVVLILLRLKIWMEKEILEDSPNTGKTSRTIAEKQTGASKSVPSVSCLNLDQSQPIGTKPSSSSSSSLHGGQSSSGIEDRTNHVSNNGVLWSILVTSSALILLMLFITQIGVMILASESLPSSSRSLTMTSPMYASSTSSSSGSPSATTTTTTSSSTTSSSSPSGSSEALPVHLTDQVSTNWRSNFQKILKIEGGTIIAARSLDSIFMEKKLLQSGVQVEIIDLKGWRCWNFHVIGITEECFPMHSKLLELIQNFQSLPPILLSINSLKTHPDAWRTFMLKELNAPTVLTSNQLSPTKRKRRLKVDHSSNVFLENLHSTKALNTTHYLTNPKQPTDFFWFRDSGLRINIGLQNVNIIPVFQDVSHLSDNDFMLHKPNKSEETHYFEELTKNFCRHPVPDFYSLTLEVIGNSSTNHECPSEDRLSCFHPSIKSSTSGGKGTCSSKKKSHKEADNSITCSGSGNLLEEVFHTKQEMQAEVLHLKPFCQSAYSRCRTCLTNSQCHKSAEDLLSESCCLIHCYASTDCRLTHSSQCWTTPRDVCQRATKYRYTLEPVFKQPDTHFRCHVRVKTPKVFYSLWFYLTIAKANFETTRVFRKVSPEEAGGIWQGRVTHEFLAIDHVNGLRSTTGDSLMSGVRDGQDINFTLSPLRQSNRDPSSPHVSFSSPHLKIIHLEFETPFDYSTSSWGSPRHRDGDDDDDDDDGVDQDICVKDASKFRRVSTSRDEGDGVHESDVSVVINKNIVPYEYSVKTLRNPPLVLFSIPGNASVLRWWFRNVTRPNSSPPIRIQVILAPEEKFMTVKILGQTVPCPGFLSIIIEDLTEWEELYRYDLLNSCPPNFIITFNLPLNLSQPLKTFKIIADDLINKRTFLLTHVWLRSSGKTVGNSDPVTFEMKSQVENQVGSQPHEVSIFHPFVLVTMLSVLVVSLIMERHARQLESDMIKTRCFHGLCLAGRYSHGKHPRMIGRRKRKWVALNAVHVIYCLAFSLSITTSTLTALFRLSSLRMDNKNVRFEVLKDKSFREHLIDSRSLNEDMERICELHKTETLRELFRSCLEQVERPWPADRSLLSKLLVNQTSRVTEHIRQQRKQLLEKFSQINGRFISFLRPIMRNPWFLFSLGLLQKRFSLRNLSFEGVDDVDKIAATSLAWNAIFQARHVHAEIQRRTPRRVPHDVRHVLSIRQLLNYETKCNSSVKGSGLRSFISPFPGDLFLFRASTVTGRASAVALGGMPEFFVVPVESEIQPDKIVQHLESSGQMPWKVCRVVFFFIDILLTLRRLSKLHLQLSDHPSGEVLGKGARIVKRDEFGSGLQEKNSLQTNDLRYFCFHGKLNREAVENGFCLAGSDGKLGSNGVVSRKNVQKCFCADKQMNYSEDNLRIFVLASAALASCCFILSLVSSIFSLDFVARNDLFFSAQRGRMRSPTETTEGFLRELFGDDEKNVMAFWINFLFSDGQRSCSHKRTSDAKEGENCKDFPRRADGDVTYGSLPCKHAFLEEAFRAPREEYRWKNTTEEFRFPKEELSHLLMPALILLVASTFLYSVLKALILLADTTAFQRRHRGETPADETKDLQKSLTSGEPYRQPSEQTRIVKMTFAETKV